MVILLQLPHSLRLLDRIVRVEIETDTVDAVSLIGRRSVAFALENMAQMTPAVRADDLDPLHAKSAVHMSRDSSRDRVEKRWPPASRLELLSRFVEWSFAAGTSVDAFLRKVLVEFATVWSFCALLTQNAELFCQKNA